MGIAPTGKQIKMTNIGIARITDGRWMETSVTADTMHVMQQLGAIPKQ
jgi:predicted ester cyclase